MSFHIPTGCQIRAARALCRVEQAELAAAADLSIQTIKRLEGFRGPVDVTTRTVVALMTAFRSFGIVFDLEVGTGPGLRFLDEAASDARGTGRNAHRSSGSGNTLRAA